jgi:hypothetical protein
MARYLIVAHQTAGSPELLERVRALAAADPAASFTLLVPATPTGHLLHNWEEGEARQLARRRAARRWPPWPRPGPGGRGPGRQPLAPGGGRRRAPGPSRLRPDRALDLPPGVSRWLKGNLPAILERRFRAARRPRNIPGEDAELQLTEAVMARRVDDTEDRPPGRHPAGAIPRSRRPSSRPRHGPRPERHAQADHLGGGGHAVVAVTPCSGWCGPSRPSPTGPRSWPSPWPWTLLAYSP